jgi:2-dehydro-3-deoxyphosphooctonate aldolase (KDO 8-P synthase)
MSQKIVRVGEIECGSDELFLISGPCVIEDEKIMMTVAEQLREIQERVGIKIIYKSSFQKDNRSSLNYYNGPGLEKGIQVLAKVKEQFGFPVLTDVHYPDQCAAVADVVDVIQIPAYLCMQTMLVTAAAKTGRVVNVKHGQFLAPENMKHPVKKIEESGNDQIILTERGFTFGYNDLVVDPRAFYHMARTNYPVVFDVTHAIRKYGIPSADAKGGAREYLPVLARAGVAAGVDGLFVETHTCPSEALCDAASQLDIKYLEEFLKPLLELHAVEVKYRNILPELA